MFFTIPYNHGCYGIISENTDEIDNTLKPYWERVKSAPTG